LVKDQTTGQSRQPRSKDLFESPLLLDEGVYAGGLGVEEVGDCSLLIV
jgi:hypothetical protein